MCLGLVATALTRKALGATRDARSKRQEQQHINLNKTDRATEPAEKPLQQPQTLHLVKSHSTHHYSHKPTDTTGRTQNANKDIGAEVMLPIHSSVREAQCKYHRIIHSIPNMLELVCKQPGKHSDKK